ncbi:hypothetical protein [Kineobactrum salinum]|uniref:Uncharacterized protein n=1 Tax=Kineobactrum salinum TaxID=2708301 RepID=A0A6C0U7E1_9GAMM|nr:hypothetical protein [Kineobactrum salinum]QIB66877.1 hypothetical protein G3T16_17255 [Kineobactrum salinum]
MTNQPLHLRLVEVMSVGSTTGIIVATLGYMVVNRLLDGQLAMLGLNQESIEVKSFIIVWMLTFLHGVIRRERAWMDQGWMIALLSLAAAVLNWMTTGDHPVKAAMGGLWSVFGVDLTLLAGFLVAGYAAFCLRNYGKKPVGSPEHNLRDISVALVIAFRPGWLRVLRILPGLGA